MTRKLFAVVAVVFLAALTACSAKPAEAQPSTACELLAEANASTSDPTTRWVAAGQPAQSADRAAIRQAMIAAPDLYQKAWAVASAGQIPAFGRLIGASRQVSEKLAAGVAVTDSDSDSLAAAKVAAAATCPSDS